jgi:hypothetical protein
MKDDLMRRISNALDSADGLAGDEGLQEILRSDPDAAKYAKDVARVNKWLAVWPMPEPDDAAYEALASRIEQRFDESLRTASDPTSPPVFDDDDALRDSTASLLQPAEVTGEFTGEFSSVRSGEYQISDSQIEILGTDPGLTTAAVPIDEPIELKPVSPIAKVTLNKKRKPAIVEDVAPEHASGEPRSAAELELKLVERTSDPEAPPKKRKKKKSESTPGTTPSPVLSAAKPSPALAPVKTLAPVKRDEPKPTPILWWFAAAAAIGLGAFGAATMVEEQEAPTHGSTPIVTAPAIAAYAPTATVAREPDPAPVAPPLGDSVGPAAPPATIVAAMPPASAASPATAGTRARRDDSLALGGAATGSGSGGTSAHRSAGGGGAADDALAGMDGLAGARTSTAPTRTPSAPSPAATSRPAPPPPTTATTTVTTAPPPPPTHAATPEPSPPPPSDLPDTPDRDTIQAVLAGRTDAVRECAAGQHGLADVDVVIASTGRITTATVNGPFAGTPVGSCIARAVRGARFPAFAQPRFEVTYPYHL